MKFLKYILVVQLLGLYSEKCFSQATNNTSSSIKNAAQEYYSPIHFGLGVGLDYGGIGTKFEYLPLKYLGIFGSLGYNLRHPGVNAGVQFRPLYNKKLQPLLLAMYGYNAVILISNAKRYSKTYYGPSIGLGGELKVGQRGNRIYMALILPFRSATYRKDRDFLKQYNPNEDFEDASPITFSIGFNWVL